MWTTLACRNYDNYSRLLNIGTDIRIDNSTDQQAIGTACRHVEWILNQRFSYQALFFTLPFPVFLCSPFVMLLFAFGQADVQLDSPFAEMQIERYECETGTLGFTDQLADFSRVKQQFA